MDRLLYLLPLLACPLGMGLVMWLMMRPGRGSDRPTEQPRTDVPLTPGERAELDQLRAASRAPAERHDQRT
ncbi:MAG: hypothetical protein ACRDV1_15445 [Actinomycetes bacterium]